MKQSELKSATIEELKKNLKSKKLFVALFTGASFALSLFAVLDYFREGKVEATTIGFLICTLGGLFSLLLGLKPVKKELNSIS